MLVFSIAVFFLLITPGPGVLSVAGVGSAFGSKPGLRYIAGLFVGTNLVALAVVTGMAAVILANPDIRLFLLIVSAGYLLFLAARIAFSGSRIAFSEQLSAPGFWGGITLQAVNPKAYVVNTTFFTGFAFWPDSLMTETLLKLLMINAIWVPIHFLWLYAGISLHRLKLPGHVQFRINVIMALLMLGVVALAVFAPK